MARFHRRLARRLTPAALLLAAAPAAAECTLDDLRLVVPAAVADGPVPAAAQIVTRGECPDAQVRLSVGEETIVDAPLSLAGDVAVLDALLPAAAGEHTVTAQVFVAAQALEVAADVRVGADLSPAPGDLALEAVADPEGLRVFARGSAATEGVAQLVCVQPCAQPDGALTLDVGRAPVRAEGFQAELVLPACTHPSLVVCELVPNGAGAGEGPFAAASRGLGEDPAGPIQARGAVTVGFDGLVDRAGVDEAAEAMADRLPAGPLGDLLGAADGRRLAGSLLNDPIAATLGFGGVSFDVDGFGGRLGFGVGEGDGAPPPPAEGQGGEGDFGGLYPGGLPPGFFEGFGLGGVGAVPAAPGVGDWLGGLSFGGLPGVGGDSDARARRALGPAMGAIADALHPPVGAGQGSATSPVHAGGLPDAPPGALDDVSEMIYGAGSLIMDATATGGQVTAAAAGGALYGILKGTWSMLKMAGDAAAGMVVTQSLNAAEKAELDRTLVQYDVDKDGSPYSFCSKHFEGRTALFKHCMADQDNAEEWRCSDKNTGSDKKDCKPEGGAGGGSQMCLEDNCDDTGRNPFVRFPKAQGDRAGLATAVGCTGRSEAGRPMDPHGEQCAPLKPISVATVDAIACKRTCMAAMCSDTACGPVAMPSRVAPGYTGGGVNPANTTPAEPR